MATSYRLDFGVANAGGVPVWNFFGRGDTGAPLTQPAFYEIGGGWYGFDFDWTTAPAGVTTILCSATNGIELGGELSTGDAPGSYVPALPGAVLPGQVTLASLRTAAKQRADMEGSGFVKDSEWLTYINGSWARLYGLLIEKFGADYYAPERYRFTSIGGVDTYPLPDGSTTFQAEDGTAARSLFKLLGVDVQVSGTPTGWLPLRPFAMGERNGGGVLGQMARRPRYRLAKGSLWLQPVPQAGLTFRVLYAPRLTPLVLDTDVVDGVNGWEEYITVDAARKALTKEESDTGPLERELAEIVARIEHEADNRDLSEPATVADVVYGGGSGFGFGGPY